MAPQPAAEGCLRLEQADHRSISTAILGRPIHHTITINIRLTFHRLIDTLKAGLVKPADFPA
jgi:hypothetical protein